MHGSLDLPGQHSVLERFTTHYIGLSPFQFARNGVKQAKELYRYVGIPQITCQNVYRISCRDISHSSYTELSRIPLIQVEIAALP
jgi:hypothetical protein